MVHTAEERLSSPEAHIAILTNHGDQEFGDEARTVGVNVYFLKENLLAIRRKLDNPNG